jgi:glutamine synthetase
MGSLSEFTIQVDRDLGERLVASAKACGLSPEQLIADCISQQLELAVRYRTVLDRLDAMDEHVITLAQFVGEATQDAGGIDLNRVCRYRQETPEGK